MHACKPAERAAIPRAVLTTERVHPFDAFSGAPPFPVLLCSLLLNA